MTHDERLKVAEIMVDQCVDAAANGQGQLAFAAMWAVIAMELRSRREAKSAWSDEAVEADGGADPLRAVEPQA